MPRVCQGEPGFAFGLRLGKSERSTANDQYVTRIMATPPVVGYRNVYIDCEDASSELMRRAHRIEHISRTSPKMDDVAIQELTIVVPVSRLV